MKIAYLSNSRFPSERAHAVQIVEVCNAFAETGNEVTLIVNTRPTDVTDAAEDYYGKPLLFNVKKLWVPDVVRFGPIFFHLANLIYLFNLLRTRSLRGFDVIYVRNEWIAYWTSFFYPIKKLVWESHEAKFNYAARSILRCGMKTVCISEGIRDTYLTKQIPGKQLLVAHDGIDDSFFGATATKEAVRQTLDLPTDQQIAMYIGGFEDWKGIETFCAASALAPDVLFVAVGGKPAQVEEYRVRYPGIRFLGPLPYKELKENQQAADVLVVPNSAKGRLSEYTSPLKLFAHMTSGVPLVVSDLPSLTVVTGRELATTFTPDDPSALAAAIRSVFADQEQKQLLAAQLREVAKRYTWKERANQIMTFLTT